MPEVSKEISVWKENNLYYAALGGDNCSGIKVSGTTKAECIKNLSGYLFDMFDEIEE